MEPGFFISVEGGEGVGKSTFVDAFVHALRTSPELNSGCAVVQTREPGGTPVANAIRGLFANPPVGEALTPEAEAMLVMAARAQHVAHLIRPALDTGRIVISDRFFDSTFVYQGIIGGLDGKWLESANRSATKGLQPDMTILLDCPVDISLARGETRAIASAKAGTVNDGASRYDAGTREQHERIRAGFLGRAAEEPGRFVVLDATRPVDTLVAEAASAMQASWQKVRQTARAKALNDG